VRKFVWLTVMMLMVAVIAVFAMACEDDPKDEDDPDCQGGLHAWFDTCEFGMSLDGIGETSRQQAKISCDAQGKLWDNFLQCYDEEFKPKDKDCQTFAACVPTHGFVGPDESDDDTVADDDSSPADDDDDDNDNDDNDNNDNNDNNDDNDTV
jgi:hypothetical protein